MIFRFKNRAVACFFLFSTLCSQEVVIQPKSLQDQPAVLNHKKEWREVQNTAKDTVVQLFVYTAKFNWLEPYKSPRQSRAAGSGFFIDDQGRLLTNYHVVHEATSIKVQIPSFGKERFDATIVGVSPDRDIALLKLADGSIKKMKKHLGHISYLRLGNSDNVVRTQQVLSLGYPLGQQKLKSTQGIVSGRERIGRESYFQMTAALNPGSSGGPCLNDLGEVIGINTAGVVKAQNVGYIIPISDVKSVIKRLYREKIARQPFLGVEMNYSNDAMLEYLGNPKPGGVYVARVFKNTFFDRLGIHQGDVLYKLDNYKLDRFGESQASWSEDKVSLIDIVNRLYVGQQLRIVVHRRGERKEFRGKLTLSDQLSIRRFYPKFETIDFEIIGGMVVMQLALNHLLKFVERKPEYVKFTERENRYEPVLIISHVFADSPVHNVRFIRSGDIISEVNGNKVKTLTDFRKAIRDHADEKFISIKNEDQNLMVLSIEDIIAKEDILASLYTFKKSLLVEELEKIHRKRSLLAPQTLVPLPGMH